MKIIVLGGGIAGLATSAFLAKQGKHVVVIEKSNSFEDHDLQKNYSFQLQRHACLVWLKKQR